MEIMAYFLVALGASGVGSISGIGGGVIIKLVLDCIGLLPASTVSFLSGCTVFAMAVSNMIRNQKSSVALNYQITVFLALGASIGGIIGKQIFSGIKENLGLIQAVLLFLLNLLVFFYVRYKSRICSFHVANKGVCIAIGLMLGFVSSFLGIGGGPINIAVLYFFFSMGAKETARNSLFIILCSQATSLATTVFANSIPEFPILALVLMCFGGVAGALIGSEASRKMKNAMVEKLFSCLLIALIALNVWNIVKFMA